MAGKMDDYINTISSFLLVPGITFVFFSFLATFNLFLGSLIYHNFTIYIYFIISGVC